MVNDISKDREWWFIKSILKKHALLMYTTFSGNRQQIFVLSSVSRINSHVLGGEVQIHLEYVIDLNNIHKFKKTATLATF